MANEFPEDRLRTARWVLALIGVADPSTLYRWYKAGRFPTPQYVGTRRVWPESAVRAWLEAELARDPAARHGAANLKKVAP